ncbi:MAG: glycosyltransferase family 2 protein [Candidatus Omnitrophota bacterium]|nr:glycosyltransferase family 2 protein [Candidatus Omnitrophota bacterium]
MPLLSVIIPVYNEVSTLRDILEKIYSVDVDKEIIVVDDGSSDGSIDLLREITDKGIKVIYCAKNRGKGAAFLTGIENARGEFVIPQDADLEYNPQDYVALVDYALKNNLAVVYGSRFLKTWRTTSFWHYLVNKTLTTFTNILFRSSLTDMETCYKLVRLDLIKKLNLSSSRFEIEPEITAKILKQGYKITEIPISYKSRFYHQGKKIGWRDGISSIFCLLKLRLIRD